MTNMAIQEDSSREEPPQNGISQQNAPQRGALQKDTLFDRYGGFAKVRRVVLDFYDRALDSELIGDFFAQIDMRRLVDHQTKFISFLLGGPVDVADQRLRAAHAHLGVEHAHFDEVIALLTETLDDHGFAAADIELVSIAVEARRSLIVS